MKEKPAFEEVLNLRKGLRKRKVPSLDLLDDHGRFPGVGSYNLVETERSVLVSWSREGAGGMTSEALFDDMCVDPNFEGERLDFGWLMYEIAHFQAQTARSRYGDGIEVSHYIGRLHGYANNWEHWALIPAGHMLLPAC